MGSRNRDPSVFTSKPKPCRASVTIHRYPSVLTWRPPSGLGRSRRSSRPDGRAQGGRRWRRTQRHREGAGETVTIPCLAGNHRMSAKEDSRFMTLFIASVQGWHSRSGSLKITDGPARYFRTRMELPSCEICFRFKLRSVWLHPHQDLGQDQVV
jgi:hypothetical protein